MTEVQIQSKCYQAFWNKYPEYRRCLFSVPNGGTRNKAEAMQLKASGLVAGVPDMLFVCRGTVYGLEFKTETGVVSSEQNAVHAAFAGQGVKTYIVRSEEQFWAIVKSIIFEGQTV